MPQITLPDGAIKQFDHPVSGYDIAKDISSSLAKKAIAVVVNDEIWDLHRLIDKDAMFEIMTKDDPRALELLRHDAAHVMAEAVKELYPETQVTIGPAIENGFYYDFHRETPFTPDDLVKIEKRMQKIVDRREEITREVWDRNKAIDYFTKDGEVFKAEIIRDLPEDEMITVYRQGAFLDLCRGPHLPTTGHLGKFFKLMSVAGAYWRGDSNNPMLQRIYGTAWATKEQLDGYLHQLAEAERRDHRRIGPQMGLFHIQEEAAGAVFWHEKGWKIYRLIEEYIRAKVHNHYYQEIKTPMMVDQTLWRQSGHWDKFRDNMFEIKESDDKTLAIKPMNCPCHVQVFKQGTKSYRDLPLRLAEFGSCHRNEPSGALHGIMRLRAFTQDDGHVFCTRAQIVQETKLFCEQLQTVYADFGFEQVRVKFSDRPEKRAGEDHVWDEAEAALEEAAKESGLEVTLNPGEGAFYGPKLEFVLTDAIGREWQCGTLQVDFVMPERLNAAYIDEEGAKQTPVMLHRAILGSFERFMGVLIEHYAGHLPLWLAPDQIAICTINNDVDDYADHIQDLCQKHGLRSVVDKRNEKIGYKIREHSHAKIPVIIVLGRQEAEGHQVAIRRLGSTKNTVMDLKEALKSLASEGRMPL